MTALLVVGGAFTGLARGDDPATPSCTSWEDLHPEVAKYLQVADVLFPRKLLEEGPSHFTLTLRFLPSFGTESQIVLSKTPSGGYTVTRYSLPNGSKTAWHQMEEITSESKIEDSVEIAKRIKVEVRNVDVPSSLLSPQVDRISKLTLFPFKELDLDFARMDATEYQFWLQRIRTPVGFHVSLEGEVYGEGRKPHPLVRWMNEIKALVEKYAGTEQPRK
jgi:hypothetical protein